VAEDIEGVVECAEIAAGGREKEPLDRQNEQQNALVPEAN
jgi:hypothetical protein